MHMLLGFLWTLLSVGVVGVLLIMAERGKRSRNLHPELTRKFIHVTVGTFVAFWPFYMSWREIAIISLLFMLVIYVSVKYNIFRSIHEVKRNATGEFMFALAIGVLAAFASSKWVFMAAMLNLSIADGMAALVGILKGEHNEYKIFGHTKSRSGTIAFLITSFLISIVYTIVSHSPATFINIAVTPVLATITENLAVNGTDNLAIPVVVALLLGGSV